MRRIQERNQTKRQNPLFPAWRFRALFTNNPAPLVGAESTHHGHATIEQLIADLRNSALAHLPSGRCCANAAWVVCATVAFSLTRALGVLTSGRFSKATTGTIRIRSINLPAAGTLGAQATSATPRAWTAQPHWQRLWIAVKTT